MDNETELDTIRAWLINNGFESDSFAYPISKYDAAFAADVLLRFRALCGYRQFETHPAGAREPIAATTVLTRQRLYRP